MLLNLLSPNVKPKLIPQLAGFSRNKNCTAQVTNLTQFIEDFYERGEVTGAANRDINCSAR